MRSSPVPVSCAVVRAMYARLTALCLASIAAAMPLPGLADDVTLRWDYTESGADGFVLYCGPYPRYYDEAIDVGNADIYALALEPGATRFCAVTAYDPAGAQSDFSNEIGINPEGMALSLLPPGDIVPTATGFLLTFNRRFDPSRLNLYGSEAGGEGGADVRLVGMVTGPVRGSIVLDSGQQGFTFVRTGGTLLPDTYTLTVDSRDDSVLDQLGRALDGNYDGIPGPEYSVSFAVEGPKMPVLSLPEFARAPGQAVNLPAVDPAAGIPVRIGNGSAVSELSFVLRYDPAMLSLLGIELAVGVEATLAAATIDNETGIAQAHVQGITGLSDASTVLLRLQAQVPHEATFGRQHVLDIANLVVNGTNRSGYDDDGLHLVAALGDATGDQNHSSLDALHIQRITVRYDTGFSAYPLTDPVVLGDVNGNGRLDSLDALLIQRKGLKLPVAEIP